MRIASQYHDTPSVGTDGESVGLGNDLLDGELALLELAEILVLEFVELVNLDRRPHTCLCPPPGEQVHVLGKQMECHFYHSRLLAAVHIAYAALAAVPYHVLAGG